MEIMENVFVVNRHHATLSVVFKTSGMYFAGTEGDNDSVEIKVDLFPLDFYEKLKEAVDNKRTAYPRIKTGFGTNHKFTIIAGDHTKINGEIMYCLGIDNFEIDLREQEIRILLSKIKSCMTQ